MWDTIQKLEYRARAGIADAREELNTRLTDRLELPLSGLHGEKLFCSIVHSVLDGTYDQVAAEEKLKRAYHKYLRENLFTQ